MKEFTAVDVQAIVRGCQLTNERQREIEVVIGLVVADLKQSARFINDQKDWVEWLFVPINVKVKYPWSCGETSVLGISFSSFQGYSGVLLKLSHDQSEALWYRGKYHALGIPLVKPVWDSLPAVLNGLQELTDREEAGELSRIQYFLSVGQTE